MELKYEFVQRKKPDTNSAKEILDELPPKITYEQKTNSPWSTK